MTSIFRSGVVQARNAFIRARVAGVSDTHPAIAVFFFSPSRRRSVCLVLVLYEMKYV